MPWRNKVLDIFGCWLIVGLGRNRHHCHCLAWIHCIMCFAFTSSFMALFVSCCDLVGNLGQEELALTWLEGLELLSKGFMVRRWSSPNQWCVCRLGSTDFLLCVEPVRRRDEISNKWMTESRRKEKPFMNESLILRVGELCTTSSLCPRTDLGFCHHVLLSRNLSRWQWFYQVLITSFRLGKLVRKEKSRDARLHASPHGAPATDVSESAAKTAHSFENCTLFTTHSW